MFLNKQDIINPSQLGFQKEIWSKVKTGVIIDVSNSPYDNINQRSKCWVFYFVNQSFWHC